MKWFKVPSDIKQYGLLLNNARVEKCSQSDAAKKLNTNQTTISMVDRGAFAEASRISEKTVDLIHSYADFVGIPRLDFGRAYDFRTSPVAERPKTRRIEAKKAREADQNDAKAADEAAAVTDLFLMSVLYAVKSGAATPEGAASVIRKFFKV